MTKLTDTSNPAAVNEYITKLNEPAQSLVKAIRQVILLASDQIGEQIKWNSPSFFYTGHMQAFNAKEYKRDLIVLNLRQKDHLLLIFPTGVTIEDTTGLLEGDYADGRRMVKIFSMEDLEVKQEALQHIIKQWLALIET
ncbi:DUF1801 domain-containing protein [Mucilaginibacter sp. PAMB04274]|uniref:DUF1801 domain-containing protein n=1 Tax=Mucilaginibacter sp. PAMB04274 TaxID=3138568 RepID=UPI0031F71F94